MTNFRFGALFPVVVLTGLLAGEPDVNATDLFNNLNPVAVIAQTIPNADAYGGGMPQLYDSFSTSTSAFALTDVTVALRNGSTLGYSPSDANDVLTVSLYANNPSAPLQNSTTGSGPGALLTSAGTLLSGNLSSAWTNYDLTLSSPYILQPNTRYWIGLRTVDTASHDDATQWGSAYYNTGYYPGGLSPTVSGEIHVYADTYVPSPPNGDIFNNYNTAPNTSGSSPPLLMEVSGNAVPEPGSHFLLGAAALALAAFQRYRRPLPS
jgi:hypothetical protein